VADAGETGTLRGLLDVFVAAGSILAGTTIDGALPQSKARAVLTVMGETVPDGEKEVCVAGAQAAEKVLKGRLPGVTVASYQVLVGVGRAVTYLHARNVVHGDLKTQNILLDREGTPKLADFGIARAVQSTLGRSRASTLAGGGQGTPGYMAPELLDGGRTSKAADVYALAMVVAEVLTGTMPFADVLPAAIAGQVKQGTRPVLPPGCASEVRQAVRAAWDSDATQRPSVWDLQEALIVGRRQCLDPAPTVSLEANNAGLADEGRREGGRERGQVPHLCVRACVEASKRGGESKRARRRESEGERARERARETAGAEE